MCYRIIFFKMWSFAVVRFLCFFMCDCAMCCMIPGLGPDSIIKMAPYQYRKSHCGDTTISRSFYLHNGISYTGNRTSLYWIGALLPNEKYEYELFIACSIVAEDQQTGDWTFNIAGTSREKNRHRYSGVPVVGPPGFFSSHRQTTVSGWSYQRIWPYCLEVL